MANQTNSHHILIVDDMRQMCKSIERMLNDLGEQDVAFVTSGEEAIKRISDENFDIIFCDYNLGEGKDGQEVLEECRMTNILDPSAIFFMITAETSIPYVLGAIEFQPDDYLSKPFSKDLLRRRIDKALEKETEIRLVRAALKQEKYELAVKLCQQQLTSKTKHIQTYAKLLGETYLKIENFAKAASFYKTILKRSDFHWARLGLGQAEYHMGEFAAAKKTFSELIEVNPYYIEGYDWMSKCALAMDDPEQAQSILQEGTKLCPKSLNRQKTLGDVARQNKDLESAGKAYRMAIRHGENSCQKSFREYTNFSEVLVEQGKHHKALLNLKDAKKSLKHRHDDLLRISTGIIDIHVSQNHQRDAKDELERARVLYEKQPGEISEETALTLVGAALATGDKEAVEKLVHSIVKNNPENEAFHGEIDKELKENTEICELNISFDATSDLAHEFNTQGIQLANEGKPLEALKLFESAAKESPHNRSFNLNAAQVMITYMQEEGIIETMQFKTRRYLEKVFEMGQSDERHMELVARYETIFGAQSLSINSSTS